MLTNTKSNSTITQLNT